MAVGWDPAQLGRVPVIPLPKMYGLSWIPVFVPPTRATADLARPPPHGHKLHCDL